MIYFCSDLHLQHYNIIKSCDRPFDTVEEMNNTIINNWNSIVGKNDVVYFLGDMYMNNPKVVGKLSEQLNGQIILIKGNHDKIKDIKKYFPQNRFVEIHRDTEISYNFDGKSYHFHLNHFPIWSWNRRIHKSVHLHGHCHFKDPLWNEFDKNGLSMDVGVDGNDYEPISIEEIIKLMIEKEINLYGKTV